MFRGGVISLLGLTGNLSRMDCFLFRGICNFGCLLFRGGVISLFGLTGNLSLLDCFLFRGICNFGCLLFRGGVISLFGLTGNLSLLDRFLFAEHEPLSGLQAPLHGLPHRQPSSTQAMRFEGGNEPIMWNAVWICSCALGLVCSSNPKTESCNMQISPLVNKSVGAKQSVGGIDGTSMASVL